MDLRINGNGSALNTKSPPHLLKGGVGGLRIWDLTEEKTWLSKRILKRQRKKQER
jgi:hypothetical protein